MNKNRLYLFYALLLVGLLTLLGRLFELQVILGAKNRAIAEGNRIRKVVEPAPRGIIYDRHGQPLVRNVPIYRLRQEDCLPEEGDCFGVITREEALKIEAQGGEAAERLRVDVGRDYLYGAALAQVLGYLGEADKEEVSGGVYQLGALVGRTGVEEIYDQTLRGQDGGEIFEVDSQNNKIRQIGKIEPVSGEDLHLSIDGDLSKIAFEALSGQKGAIVATDVQTGEVIVLVSSPSFNPDKIEAKVLTDPELPMFNRAIGGVYPPGSTFKVVTAVAGIEEGKVDEQTIYEDTGQIKIGDYTYRNWYFTQYGRTEGAIDLVKAIKRSTDTFFYKVGEWVGATKLAQWARAFGLGRETGIDLPGEVTGLVPDPDWKEAVKGERWFLGNTYHFAIGQADLLTTPLQVNQMTSIIASQGRLCQPQVKRLTEVNCQDLQLKPLTLKMVGEGMKQACSPEGTAFPFFEFSPQVACKTGTAEFNDPEGRTHAWLTAFAPVDDPEIVVTALVEAGGEGSDVAAPMVKKVMEAWFKKD